MHPRPPVAASRIAHARVLHRDAAAEYSQGHPLPGLDSRPGCAPVAGHVRSVVKGGKLVVPWLPVPRLGSLSPRVEVARRVCLLGWAGHLLEALGASASLPASRRAWVYLVQMVTAKRQLELLSAPGAPARVCLADRAQPASFPQAQPMDSRQQPAMGRPVGRPRELAVEYSWDFRF